VIYDPAADELFTATRGVGAYCNDTRLRVSRRREIKSALIGTGFPYKEVAHIETYLAMLRDAMKNSAGVRRAGSAALDLAYVAAGRLDAFWEIGLARWDMAAGALLVLEAGGLVGDLEGNGGYLNSGNIAAGNANVFSQLLQMLAPHLTAGLKSR